MPVIPKDVIAAARASMAKWKVVPASVCIAQWAVESEWGKHMPPDSNNPFGIKYTPGLPYVPAATWEYIRDRRVRITDPKDSRCWFRKFASMSEAFDQHGKLLATSKYYVKARATKTADAFADALTGIYATAPNYGATLKSIMKSNNLYQYDKAA